MNATEAAAGARLAAQFDHWDDEGFYAAFRAEAKRVRLDEMQLWHAYIAARDERLQREFAEIAPAVLAVADEWIAAAELADQWHAAGDAAAVELGMSPGPRRRWWSRLRARWPRRRSTPGS